MDFDALEQEIIENVARHGWQCMAVGGGGETPNFAYSVGWTETLASPEAIVFGLTAAIQHAMLWALFRRIEAGARLREGARISGLLEGADCILREIHPTQSAAYLRSANWYRRLRRRDDGPVRAYQLFWPGKADGLFPWEEGCSAVVRADQPLLQAPREQG